MSSPEWNAIRWSYRQLATTYRRTLVVYCGVNAAWIALCALLFVADLWAAFGVGTVLCAVTATACARMVRHLHDMQERLDWIERHW